MTEEERKLWFLFLRGYPVRFLRQKVIDNYIVDFYCSQANLVIEVDGGQHYDNEQACKKDKIRDANLQGRGLKVLRFSNMEIQREFQAVCEYIDRIVQERIALQ